MKADSRRSTGGRRRGRHPEPANGTDPTPDPEPDEAAGFDAQYFRDAAGFVLRSARRRPVLAGFVFLLALGVGLTVAASIAPIYRAQVQLLAVPVPRSGDAAKVDLVAYAAQVVHSPDTLVKLARAAGLPAQWDRQRPLPLRWKDRLVARLRGGQPSDDDKLRATAGILESKLSIAVEEGAVTVRADWPEPQTAFDLVELARAQFVGIEYDAEIKLLTDPLALAEKQSSQQLAKLREALQGAAARPAPRPSSGPSSGVRQAPGAPAPGAPAVDAALVTRIQKQEQQLSELEGAWRQALRTRQDELNRLLRDYTENYPAVVPLRDEVERLRTPPDDLVQARRELADLCARLDREVRVPPPVAPRIPEPASEPAAEPAVSPTDEESLLARSNLDAAVRGYEAAEQEVDRQNALLEVTRKQAHERFSVAASAAVPRRPVKALAPLVAAGSLLAAILLALLATASADLATGRVLEPWQVRRRLKVDLLGELP